MMKLTHILQKTAHQHPDHSGISFSGKTISWKEVLERCERLAGGLATLKLEAGDRLAILSQNSARMVELFYGPLWIGVVPVPLNWRWTLQELVPCLKDSQPVVLAADETHAETALALQRQCASIRDLVYMGEGEAPPGFIAFEDLIDGAERVSYCPFGGKDLAAIVYTGGTTGRSKGVMLSHTNLYVNAMNHMEFDPVSDGQSIVLSGPMFHISSMCRVYIHTFMDVHMIILPQFDAVALMEAVQAYGATSLMLISAMAAFLLDHPRYPEFDLSSVRKINYGAAPMPPSLINRLRAEFPKVSFYHGYGATEGAGVISTLSVKDEFLDGDGVTHLNSVGKPAPYVQLRVVDTEGCEVASGEVGEIAVRGPNVMMGYLNMPEETAKVIRDDWYHTGDAGYRDAEGYVFLVDRMKDMIISGGENIYSVEVERAIDLHSAVRQCAVVGLSDETWGEVVHAVIALRPGASLTLEELVMHCREYIAGYKCPKGLHVWDELPLSGAGKIQKNEIRARLEGTVE
ncbi:MAG: AMP-binding protein [Halioglobus sp.]|nr:AMP-binding protein [Halioglobus sp.]